MNAYEVGAKYSTREFGLSLAAFRQEFTNFQLNTFNGSVFLVQNVNSCDDNLGGADQDASAATGACNPDAVAPGVIAQGVEVEATVNPIRDLGFTFGFTYSDTSYEDNLIGNDSGVPLDPALRLLPGDNLSNAIQGSGGRGLVVNGGVRDTARIYELDDFNVYCRGYDPTAIRDMTLISLNGPARMGQATAMPGDIVLGARGGIIFIPPHLAEEVVVSSENVRLRDVFGHQRLREGKYCSGEIDTQWSPQIEEDFENWKRERGE